MSTVFIVVVVGLALVLGLILLAPVRVQGTVREGHRRVSIRYLGSGIVVEHPQPRWTLTFWGLRVYSGRLVSKPRKRKLRVKKRPAEVPKLRWAALFRRMIACRQHSPALRRTMLAVLRLVGRLTGVWRLERGRIDLTFGLDDPAKTGMLLGYMSAFRGIVQRRWPRLGIVLSPDFDHWLLHLEADLTLRIIPVQPVYHLVRALGSIPWWRLWKLKRAWVS